MRHISRRVQLALSRKIQAVYRRPAQMRPDPSARDACSVRETCSGNCWRLLDKAHGPSRHALRTLKGPSLRLRPEAKLQTLACVPPLPRQQESRQGVHSDSTLAAMQRHSSSSDIGGAARPTRRYQYAALPRSPSRRCRYACTQALNGRPRFVEPSHVPSATALLLRAIVHARRHARNPVVARRKVLALNSSSVIGGSPSAVAQRHRDRLRKTSNKTPRRSSGPASARERRHGAPNRSTWPRWTRPRRAATSAATRDKARRACPLSFARHRQAALSIAASRIFLWAINARTCL